MGADFVGRLHGQLMHFTVQNGQITSPAGPPTDPAQIEHPDWNPVLGLSLNDGRYAHRVAVVHRDELGDIDPQPALPVTFGDEDYADDVDDGVLDTDDPVLGAASDRLAERQTGIVTQALKNFTSAEKDALINEGDGGARNDDVLDITGTHYQQPESETEEWLWGL